MWRDSLPLKVEEIETVHENVIRIKTKTGIDQKLLSVNDNII